MKHNSYKLELVGAWIFPDGNIHWTYNDETHLKVINDLQLSGFLRDEAKRIQWSEDELSKRYDSDYGYIAMKIGYIRISSFANQFILEYVKTPISEVQLKTIKRAFDDLQERSDFMFEDFCVEQFQARDSRCDMYHSSFEFFNAIRMLGRNDNLR